MGSVIRFEDHAVAALRERLGRAESARADLLAFALGHSGAVASIHHAVICALEAGSFEELVEIVTSRWPGLLGLDSVGLALIVGAQGFRLDRTGVDHLEPRLIDRTVRAIGEVRLRAVGRGHPLFGADAANIRAEALISLGGQAPCSRGLLLLGQAGEGPEESVEGAQLLEFLGAALGAMLRRWVANG